MATLRAGLLSQTALALFIGAGGLVAGHVPVSAQDGTGFLEQMFGTQPDSVAGSRADRIARYKAKGTAWGAQEVTVKTLLQRAGLPLGTPIFLRAFKQERELEVWARGQNGRYIKLKTMKTCYHSGTSGPKQNQGDKQVPEGVYEISANWQLNPGSQYTRAFNVGYPNAIDRAHGRTGGLIMVHGSCLSVGCLAMGDVPIKGLYDVVAAARAQGHTTQIQIFPFRMTSWNIPSSGKWASFWRELKTVHDAFDPGKGPPKVYACGKHYSLSDGKNCTSINGGSVRQQREETAPVVVAARAPEPRTVDIILPARRPALAPVIVVAPRVDPAIAEQKRICDAASAEFKSGAAHIVPAKCVPDFRAWQPTQLSGLFYCNDMDNTDPTVHRFVTGKSNRSFQMCFPLDNPEALAVLKNHSAPVILQAHKR